MHIRNNGAPNQQWVDNKRTDQICSSWGRPELILYTAWSGSPEFQSGSYTPDQNIFPPWLESSHNPLHLHCYRNWVYFLGCPAKEKSLSIFHFSEIIYSIQYKWFQFDLIKLNSKLCFALFKCKQKNVCILRIFLLHNLENCYLNKNSYFISKIILLPPYTFICYIWQHFMLYQCWYMYIKVWWTFDTLCNKIEINFYCK